MPLLNAAATATPCEWGLGTALVLDLWLCTFPLMAARIPSPDRSAAHAFFDSYDHTQTHHGNHTSVHHANEPLGSHLHVNGTLSNAYTGDTYEPFGLISDHEELARLQHTDIAYGNVAESTGAARVKEKVARTKVSKACDECRRKKIRCDVQDERAAAACTPCVRGGFDCVFSRQQLKRGPSKGYIKDLAERLQQLEQQVQDPSSSTAQSHQQHAEQRRGQTAVYVDGRSYALPNGVPEHRTGEKRPHSAIEDFSPHSWEASSTQSQPYQTSDYPPQLARNPQPFWRLTSSTNAQDAIAVPYDYSNPGPANPPGTFDWDEDVIGEYYRLIHQTFPLLPNSKTRLKYRLADCPANLREACLAALDCLTRTFPTSSLSPTPSYHMTLKRAAENLAKYPFDNPSSHTPATNLVYLQTLLLMAIETDNHGPATIRGQAGPSRAEWLGRAAGIAGQLEINTIRSQAANSSLLSGDRDSEDRLARRVWWVLFILDRWHASSTADSLKLPENSVSLLPEDQILLGESTYHLARLSFIVGHFAAILTTTKTPSTDVMAPTNPASSLLTLTLAGEVDRFRESVESVWGSLNLVHLSYHHIHLLIKRLNPLSEPSEMVGHAVKVATVLNSRATPLTPLNHHFAALSAMTLCELASIRKTRDQAVRGLQELRSCLGGGRGLAGFEGSEGWDGAVRDLVVQKLDRIEQSIESDLGTGSLHGADADDARYDPTTLTRYGYLTALAQGMVRIR